MSKTKKAPEKKRGDRVLRGGGWDSDPQFARVAVRYDVFPGVRDYVFGVRLVEVIDEQD